MGHHHWYVKMKNDSFNLKLKDLHKLVVVPEDGIGVELLSGVEPKHVPHLTPTSPIFVHICLYQIRLPSSIPQELKIQLISGWPCPILRAHLQQFLNKISLLGSQQ